VELLLLMRITAGFLVYLRSFGVLIDRVFSDIVPYPTITTPAVADYLASPGTTSDAPVPKSPTASAQSEVGPR